VEKFEKLGHNNDIKRKNRRHTDFLTTPSSPSKEFVPNLKEEP
jgi:hypothetical protein